MIVKSPYQNPHILHTMVKYNPIWRCPESWRATPGTIIHYSGIQSIFLERNIKNFWGTHNDHGNSPRWVKFSIFSPLSFGPQDGHIMLLEKTLEISRTALASEANQAKPGMDHGGFVRLFLTQKSMGFFGHLCRPYLFWMDFHRERIGFPCQELWVY